MHTSNSPASKQREHLLGDHVGIHEAELANANEIDDLEDLLFKLAAQDVVALRPTQRS